MINSTYMTFFGALCNETRLQIILSLRKSSKNVGQLAEELKMEQSRISHSLQCLTKNRFIQVKQEGKQRVYSLNKDTIEPIFNEVKKHLKKYNIDSC